MIIYILVGIALGALSVWLLYFTARREIVRIEEEKQLLQQEKHLVIEFMHHLVEGIGASVEHEQLYQRIVHAAILSTGALSGCLFEKTHDDLLKGIASEGLFPPQRPLDETMYDKNMTRAQFIEKVLKSESFHMGEGLIGSVAQSKKAILIQNAERDPRVAIHMDSALAINSMIIAPILFRNTTLGVLALANPSDAMPFTENDLSLVESLAEQASMAIHSSNLMKLLLEKNKMDFELTLACNIQQMLLPKNFPDEPNLDIDTFYRPAQKVGGDLYDVIPLSPTRTGIAIADVSGKGVPASILMAICQTNLRHFAKQLTSPSEVLKAMNREMHPEMRRDMFITITYAIIDSESKTLTLARAGHESPLLLRYDSNEKKYVASKIYSDGMALGMVPGTLFDKVVQDVSTSFNSDDLLVLYTDGVTEAANQDEEEYGFNRLASHALQNIKLSSKRINNKIIQDIEDFVGTTEKVDDLTLVTIKHI